MNIPRNVKGGPATLQIHHTSSSKAFKKEEFSSECEKMAAANTEKTRQHISKK